MQWHRSSAIGIAKASCTFCHGNGTRFRRNGAETPCDCVLRAVFRACWSRFRQCALSSGQVGTVRLEFCGGREGYRTYSLKKEEYMADFCLVSRRELDDFEYKIFRYHHLLGADWRLCCRQLNMERGDFFHTIYRIEKKLGKVFADLEPYPLYPLREYFNSVVHKNDSAARPFAVRAGADRIALPLSA